LAQKHICMARNAEDKDGQWHCACDAYATSCSLLRLKYKSPGMVSATKVAI